MSTPLTLPSGGFTDHELRRASEPLAADLSGWSVRALRGELQLRNDCVKALGDIARAGAALNPAEKEALARLDAEAERLAEALQTREAVGERGQRGPVVRPDVGEPHSTRAGGARWVDTRTGQAVRMYRPGERLSDTLPEGERGLSVGRWAQGVLTGSWAHAPHEQRLLQVGDAAAGGYTVPAPLARQIVDLARSRSVVMQLGAQTVEMESNTLAITRVTGDPTMTWFNGDEVRAAGIPESQPTFGQHQLVAQTVGCIMRFSLELVQDTVNFAQAFERTLSQAAGLALDQAILFGTTGGVRSGLRQWLPGDATNSLNEVVMGTSDGAAVADYSPFIEAVAAVLAGNYPGELEQLGVVMAPRVWGEVEGLTSSVDAQPLQPPPSYQRLRKLVSTQCPVNETQGSSTDASTIFVGDWSTIILGVRMNFTMQLSVDGSDAFTRGHALLRIFGRYDWAVQQPKFLTRIIGVVEP